MSGFRVHLESVGFDTIIPTYVHFDSRNGDDMQACIGLRELCALEE
jgi:hypothetical protein